MALRNRFKIHESFGLVLSGLLLVWLLVPCAAQASGADAVVLDPAALAQLEQQAASAQPREQCFLYTQVLQDWTEIEGRQIAAGDEEHAASTLLHMETVAAKLHSALMKDAKKLKDAELLMERTTHRVSDMVHVSSGESRVKLQAMLQHLNAVHNELLTQVFAR